MTAEQPYRFISTRRAYTFEQDELRLSLLTTQPARQQIRDTFRFDIDQIATPAPFFGPVPQTNPPGLVFNYGFVSVESNEVSPIRFLHIEPARIVFDVAGPSSAIEAAFRFLLELVANLRTPDGSPAIGKPSGVSDYSEMTFPVDGALTKLLAPKVLRILESRLPLSDGMSIVPGMHVTVQSPTEVFNGVGTLDPQRPIAAIEIRAGTRPADGILFSAVSLDTDAHIGLLEALKGGVLS